MSQLLCFLLAGFVAVSTAYAGGSSAHGGDLDRDQDNVWFLGDEPVEYCVVRKAGYPLSEPALLALIATAFGKWQTFFKKYGLDKRVFKDLADGRARGLPPAARHVDRCQAPEHQLRFVFDVDDQLVQDHRPDDDSSLGVAVRGAYDHQTFRTGGVVWIARFTDRPELVEHLLLHELGHVLGMSHNSVWVMDDTVARRISDPEESRDPALGSIESPAWPFQLRAGETLDFTYRTPGSAERPAGFAPNWLLASGVADLFGISPHDYFGGHRLTLTYAPINQPGHEAPFGRKAFTLVLERPGQAPQSLQGQFDLPARRSSGPALYTRWRAPGGGTIFDKRYLYDGPDALPASGAFALPDGRIMPAILSTHWGPVLRLFPPTTSVWWTTMSYELTLERQQMDQY